MQQAPQPEELRRELKFLKAQQQKYVDCLARLQAAGVDLAPAPAPPAAPTAAAGKQSGAAASLSGYVRSRVQLIEQQFQQFQAGQQAPSPWSRERLFAALKQQQQHGPDDKDDPVEVEMAALRQRLLEAKQRRLAVQDRRVLLAKKINQARQLRDEVQRRVNVLASQHAASVDELKATREDAATTATQLHKFSEISVINDAFYIWFAGPFATINNFRLGNSPVGRQVEWMEINAALGQAMLVVSIVASRAGLRFKHYTLHPYGSFSKVSKNDDRRILYNLFMDPTLFSLFPKSKFHPAMFGFLCCVKELGEHISAHGESIDEEKK